MKNYLYLPAYKDERKKVSEMLSYKIQTPGNYSEERIQPKKEYWKNWSRPTLSTVLTFDYLESNPLKRKMFCAHEKQFWRQRIVLWVLNQQKTFRNIYMTLNKNYQKLPAAVCRFFYKSGILALKFSFAFIDVLEGM
jgi:hypothetical protein